MASAKRVRNVRPDALDFRDLPFRPNVAVAPRPGLFPSIRLPVKDQGGTNACTGFALARVVEQLLRRARRPAAAVSPYMLYSMARRYDEFPGSKDEGSSLRGVLKGWFKHGACVDSLWRTGIEMPPVPDDPKKDWWLEAVNRPLGAYYRVATRSIADIHCALNEVGVVLASAVCHAGWDEGAGLKQQPAAPRSFGGGIWTIPQRKPERSDSGHAFAIVGYDERGFLLQNSWGASWGTRGYAVLGYDDWLENAMDCWVAQLGVVTAEHRAIARAASLRTDRRGQVELAGGEVLRNREISPFVINVGNNGRLSNSGWFRTTADDVRAIVEVHLARARELWQAGEAPLDVCIYAHGGLVSERDAAAHAAKLVPLLYGQQIFPVYLMWETDLLSTVLGRLEDAIEGMPRPTGRRDDLWSPLERWWNARLERLLAQPGTALWNEIKENAAAMSAGADAALALLHQHLAGAQATPWTLRLHLVGHSAGSIALAHLVDFLFRRGVAVDSLSFLAPAIRVDAFDRLLAPRLADGSVARYEQFHLTEKAEEDDPSCGPYRRSLLSLVSESFEGGRRTPILGIKRYFDAYGGLPAGTVAHVAPGPASTATTHGGFDDDLATLAQVVAFIKAAGSRPVGASRVHRRRRG
ncbi:MAG: C1 family peptidase [Burkholderiales bacterium]|nr:C1 family peptidase [Burkholderiales bacterium]